MMNRKILPGSFRDPSGFLFKEKGEIYRQINKCYQLNYQLLMDSGLYNELAERNLLIRHTEIEEFSGNSVPAYKIIKPEVIPFVSYPHEWCFNQLKDAALTTLKIQKIALKFGMILKDASAYNIQFKNGRPTLIDTLSFEKYEAGQPWVAYKQFCQHFLAPLALICYLNPQVNQLLRANIDGIPLELASLLLPNKTIFRFSLYSHIHLHAKAQQFFSDKQVDKDKQKITRRALLGLMESLESGVKRLQLRQARSEWSHYYQDIHYSPEALDQKIKIVLDYLQIIQPRQVWDLGANTGIFSRLASDQGIMTIAFDKDHAAVDQNYQEVVKRKETAILPLVQDLTNPTPDYGWAHEERMSLGRRGPADVILALALMHHLTISNNVPFEKIAGFFSQVGAWLIIEFVPKDDPQVQKLLATRDDIFTDYSKSSFETRLGAYFETIRTQKIPHSDRYLYLLKKRN